MKYLFLILLILISGCDVSPNTGADGYKFGKKQYTQTNLNVNIVIYPDKNSFNRELLRRGLKSDVAAFSIIYKNDPSKCTVHILDPSVKYEPEFIGHEFLHCVYGQWHTSNDKRN
jgi:hypothetical protein